MSLTEFIANAKIRNFARANKYLVIIDMPRGPSANNYGRPDPFGSLFRTGGRGANDAFGGLINNFVKADGQYLASLFCESTALPGLNIDSKINKQYGPGREIPYGRSYAPVNMSFYMDAGYQIKDFFEIWQGMIFNEDSSHLNYYNEYVTNVHILGLDMREGRFGTFGVLPDIGTLQNSIIVSRYQCTLQECYPKSVAEIQMSAGSGEVPRLQVQFQYRKWTNTSTLMGVGNVTSTTPESDIVKYNPATGTLAPAPAPSYPPGP
jgi:hypothetical protein